jgi:hypothetical protein
MGSVGMIYIRSFMTTGSAIQVMLRLSLLQFQRLQCWYYRLEEIAMYSSMTASGGMHIPSFMIIRWSMPSYGMEWLVPSRPRNHKRKTKCRNAEKLLFLSLVEKGLEQTHTEIHARWVDTSRCRIVSSIIDAHFRTAWFHTNSLKCTCAGTHSLGSNPCDDFLWVFLTNDVFANWP